MEFLEIRAVIKYFKLKGLTEKEAHAELVSALADNAPCFAMVKAWYAELSRGCTSTEDTLQNWVVEAGESLGEVH